jgi:endonuclease G
MPCIQNSLIVLCFINLLSRLEMPFRILFLLIFLGMVQVIFAQSYPESITQKQQQVEELHAQAQVLQEKIEEEKIGFWADRLNNLALPAHVEEQEIIKHALYSLVYSEQHEQALWVAHVIAPEVRFGNAGRSNDFRTDPLIKTGSCTDRDYFIRDTLPDGTLKYDGFGYDRGHLAPSADFRWSAKALSESFYYSNMSPQLAAFNRDSWAKLEDHVRSYAERNQTAVYVVTGPLLRPGLPRIERAEHKPSIPVYFYKIMYDEQRRYMSAFLMPNKRCDFGFDSYAISVDSLETLTGSKM